jgi:hypothetical protein
MSSDGGAQLNGLLFGCTIASLMFWLGAAGLPFARPVAAWFQRRMEEATMLTVLGSKSAAKNMSPGQIVFASIAALVISAIILLNAGPQVAVASAAAAPVAIFLGCAAIVVGAVLLTRAAKRPGGARLAGTIAGAALSVVGAGVTIGAVVVAISVAG